MFPVHHTHTDAIANRSVYILHRIFSRADDYVRDRGDSPKSSGAKLDTYGLRIDDSSEEEAREETRIVCSKTGERGRRWVSWQPRSIAVRYFIGGDSTPSNPPARTLILCVCFIFC